MLSREHNFRTHRFETLVGDPNDATCQESPECSDDTQPMWLGGTTRPRRSLPKFQHESRVLDIKRITFACAASLRLVTRELESCLLEQIVESVFLYC